MGESATDHRQKREKNRNPRAPAHLALVVLFVAAALSPSLAWSRRLPMRARRAAATLPTTNWLDFTIIAENRLDIGANLNLSGNFATWAAGGTLELGLNTYQLDDAPPPFVAADTLNLAAVASEANAYTNIVTGNPTGKVRGTTEPTSFPLGLSLPTFPTAHVCNNCTLSGANFVVSPGGSLTLPPGCYGERLARQNSTVFLETGTYNFTK